MEMEWNEMALTLTDVADAIEKWHDDKGYSDYLGQLIVAMIPLDTVIGYYDPTEVLYPEEVGNVKRAMDAWRGLTLKKYGMILDAYSAWQEKMFGNILVTSRNWFNDTPESKNLNSENEDLTHLTSFGKNQSEEQGGTPMQRIDEIQQAYRNTFQDWLNEFIRYFDLGARW